MIYGRESIPHFRGAIVNSNMLMPISDNEFPLIKVNFCRLFKVLVMFSLHKFHFTGQEGRIQRHQARAHPLPCPARSLLQDQPGPQAHRRHLGRQRSPPGGGASAARMAALHAGIPFETSINTINRQCSFGLTAVNQIANQIRAGQIDIGIGE